jgi:hypothetical protein
MIWQSVNRDYFIAERPQFISENPVFATAFFWRLPVAAWLRHHRTFPQ